jgi:formiminoglutamase
MNTLLNTQSNIFLDGNELLVLGHVDFTNEMQKVRNFDFHDPENLYEAKNIVAEIDEYVAPIIQAIVESGKEPIVIGGGHNNAYPCIKGTVEGLYNSGRISSKTINVINCDAHSDFRSVEGRHSGNAFSYAFKENLLDKYSIVGLHESYNTGSVMEQLLTEKERIHFSTFEEIYIKEELTFNQALTDAISFTSHNYTGLEIDLDAIQNIPSSAKTSSGLSTVEARKYIYKAALSTNIAYLHIAEAAPVLSHIKTDLKTGKLVSYLICDYIKARNEFHKTSQ